MKVDAGREARLRFLAVHWPVGTSETCGDWADEMRAGILDALDELVEARARIADICEIERIISHGDRR